MLLIHFGCCFIVRHSRLSSVRKVLHDIEYGSLFLFIAIVSCASNFCHVPWLVECMQIACVGKRYVSWKHVLIFSVGVDSVIRVWLYPINLFNPNNKPCIIC